MTAHTIRAAHIARAVRAVRGAARLSLAGAAAAALAACSSPPARFYTLDAAAAAAASAPAVSANPAFLIQVPAIDVPEQVAMNQFVVQKSPSQVDVLEQTRWVSQPADEIRRALSSALTRRLDTIDVANSAYPANVPVYRISVNVQRFESWPDRHAALTAVWSVRALPSQMVMTCRTDVVEPVQPGYDALVDGHRRAIGVLADQITAGVHAISAARAPTQAAAPAKRPAAGGAAAAPAAPVVRCPASPAARSAQSVDSTS
ncbi:PqiC family protein [Burkholderia singularis]|uniref:Ortholog of Bordetella pertussis (BX470248) BP2750 n=1 Tax=Burkholderia singularis TaxID=1503053 RepID=A0A238H957_9BURK|nr:PqiC family protein [Burkholderia singularis]SMG01991.1 ortholog of Bordetella pertussis (BX470248) BP2750 [Burkholderia singularis]